MQYNQVLIHIYMKGMYKQVAGSGVYIKNKSGIAATFAFRKSN